MTATGGSRSRTLAFGRPDAPFYRSIRRILPVFGEVVFRSEHTFVGAAHVVRWMKRRGIEQVLMPNPYGNRQRLRLYRGLRHRGVRVVASDRGALPDAWFFDAGFNADSPSYRPEAWDHPLTDPERRAVRDYVAELRRTERALEAQGQRRPAEELRGVLGLGREKVLFVPMQRPRDTVMRYFSGAVGSLEEFLALVEEVAERLGDEWRVVVKPHPLEPAPLDAGHDRIRVAPSDTHVHDLLELADAVLVVNSGVGLLGLLFGKPTIHVGTAFYAHPGLATPARTVDEVVDAVRAHILPDSDKVERFVHHLTKRVYSFGAMRGEVVSDPASGSLRRLTRSIDFRELRILGAQREVPAERVLVVSPVVPHPVTRGSESRVDTIVQALVDRGMEVSLCVLNSDDASRSPASIEADLNERYGRLREVEVMTHPRLAGFPRAAWFWLRWVGEILLGGRQRIANLDTAPLAFRRRVHRVIERLRPDYLLVNYAKLAPCLPRRFGGISIVDTHDHQAKLLREGKVHNRNRLDIVVPLYAWSERRALRRFDRIIAINPNEVPAFRAAAPDAEVFVVPAFTEPRPVQPRVEEVDALFVGSGSSFNVLGLRWFLEEVLPLVRAHRPTFELRVVGSVGEMDAIRNSTPTGVHLEGIVPDIGSAYASARIVIAPIRGGAGMKIKVVEALGFGRPIVCTPMAAEGIDIVDGRDARVEEDPARFAEAVVALLDDSALRSRLSRGGAALHARSHSRAAMVVALERLFDHRASAR